MPRNIELLQQTMQHIKDHPETHDQGVWTNVCGTAHCFAGWAARLSGWSLTTIARRMNYSAGADLLGISYEQAGVLFHTENSIPVLELMVKDLVNGDDLRDWEDYRDEARDLDNTTE